MVQARTAEVSMFMGKSSAKPAAKKVVAAKKPAFENPFAKKAAPAPAKKAAKKAPVKKANNPFVGGAKKETKASSDGFNFNLEKIPIAGGFITGFNLLRNLPK